MFLTIPLQFTMVKTVGVFSLFYLLLTFCSLDVGVQGQSKSLAKCSRFPYRNANKFVLRHSCMKYAPKVTAQIVIHNYIEIKRCSYSFRSFIH